MAEVVKTFTPTDDEIARPAGGQDKDAADWPHGGAAYGNVLRAFGAKDVGRPSQAVRTAWEGRPTSLFPNALSALESTKAFPDPMELMPSAPMITLEAPTAMLHRRRATSGGWLTCYVGAGGSPVQEMLVLMVNEAMPGFAITPLDVGCFQTAWPAAPPISPVTILAPREWRALPVQGSRSSGCERAGSRRRRKGRGVRLGGAG